MIRLPTNTWGFSTNFDIFPEFWSYTTTPYFEGSSTLVTCKYNNCFNCYIFEIKTNCIQCYLKCLNPNWNNYIYKNTVFFKQKNRLSWSIWILLSINCPLYLICITVCIMLIQCGWRQATTGSEFKHTSRHCCHQQQHQQPLAAPLNLSSAVICNKYYFSSFGK